MLNSATPLELDLEETEEADLPSNSGLVAIKRCKYDGIRLEIGDSVPQNWPKHIIEDFLACKAIKIN